MRGYNHVTLVGQVVGLVKNELTIDQNQKSTFSIRVSKGWKKDQDNDADIFEIITFGKLADICYEYLQEGRRLLVDGKLTNMHDVLTNEIRMVIVADEVTILSSPLKSDKE